MDRGLFSERDHVNLPVRGACNCPACCRLAGQEIDVAARNSVLGDSVARLAAKICGPAVARYGRRTLTAVLPGRLFRVDLSTRRCREAPSEKLRRDLHATKLATKRRC